MSRATTIQDAAALVIVLSACSGQVDLDRQRAPYLATDSMGTAPEAVTRVASRAPRSLIENSGAAMSRSQPGVFFTINDSGNDPLLFALDTAGRDRGVWRIEDAVNVDWEAISPGPCSAGAPTAHCLYIGDVGDNEAVRPDRTIYRVPEPRAGDESTAGSIRAQALHFRYDDGAHDVEAMYVSPDGATWLVTKRPLADAAGRLRPALVFRLPPEAWGATGLAVAARVDSLPIVPGSVLGRMVTDAALTPDGRHLVLRTYAQVYILATDSATGSIDHDMPPAICNVAGLRERQGEGITWIDSGGRLLLTSEGRSAPLFLVRCPLPGGDATR